jgi:hypothetical protein
MTTMILLDAHAAFRTTLDRGIILVVVTTGCTTAGGYSGVYAKKACSAIALYGYHLAKANSRGTVERGAYGFTRVGAIAMKE